MRHIKNIVNKHKMAILCNRTYNSQEVRKIKFVLITGPGAVGKMTIGQDLAKITDLRLFHNHMAIELVNEVFGYHDTKAILDMRDPIFENFAASDNYGMIFTYIWAFDYKEEWDYVEHVFEIFRKHDSEIYIVELEASLETRLKRNKTENRKIYKASKRDEAASEQRIMKEEEYRLNSNPEEIKYENYLKLDTENITAMQAAQEIKNYFNL